MSIWRLLWFPLWFCSIFSAKFTCSNVLAATCRVWLCIFSNHPLGSWSLQVLQLWFPSWTSPAQLPLSHGVNCSLLMVLVVLVAGWSMYWGAQNWMLPYIQLESVEYRGGNNFLYLLLILLLCSLLWGWPVQLQVLLTPFHSGHCEPQAFWFIISPMQDSWA